MPDGTTVFVRFTGEVVSEGGATDWSGFNRQAGYWSSVGGGASSYVTPGYVPSLPTNGDRIAVVGSAAPRQTLEFFQDAAFTTPATVSNITMLIYSLGRPTNQGVWAFDQNFSVLSDNRAQVSGYRLTRLPRTDAAVLEGFEGSGTLQFTGSFSQIAWTVEIPEEYAAWNIGVTSAQAPFAAASAFRPCPIPTLGQGESAIVDGVTVTASTMSVSSSNNTYLFQAGSATTAAFTFNPPVPAFRVSSSALTGADSFAIGATNSAATAVLTTSMVSTSARFDYLQGSQVSASATARVDFVGSGSSTANVEFFLNCSEITANRPVTTGLANAAMPRVSFTGDGFSGSVTFAVVSGTLPPGLTLDPATGFITGTPTQATSATVVISATGSGWGYATSTLTFDFSQVTLPPAVTELITRPVASPTTVPTSTPPTSTPPTSTTPSTTPPTPTPVRDTTGALPAEAPGTGVATVDGVDVAVEVFIDVDSSLVMRGQDFELRLAGECVDGCTLIRDESGREVLLLDSAGAAQVSGFGFKPGTLAHVWVFSEPVYLGALLVQPDGTFSGSFPLAGIAVGTHTLQTNGISFDDQARSANIGIVVQDSAAPIPGPGSLPATGTERTLLLLAVAVLLAGALLASRPRRLTRH